MKKDKLYYNMLGQMVSTDLQVLAYVQECNDKSIPVWFSKVVEYFAGQISKTDISKSQDRLYDMGIIDCKYSKTDDSRWANCWYVSSEADGFINRVLNCETEPPKVFL